MLNNEYLKQILNNITGIYQDDGYYAIFYKNKFLYYVDFDNFDWINTDKIKNKKQEQDIIRQIIKTEIEEDYHYFDILSLIQEIDKMED